MNHVVVSMLFNSTNFSNFISHKPVHNRLPNMQSLSNEILKTFLNFKVQIICSSSEVLHNYGNDITEQYQKLHDCEKENQDLKFFLKF